jgi:hypothetical protein
MPKLNSTLDSKSSIFSTCVSATPQMTIPKTDTRIKAQEVFDDLLREDFSEEPSFLGSGTCLVTGLLATDTFFAV